MEEGRSIIETPTWAVATVISVMVASVLFFTKSVEFFGHWLDKRKRKPLLAALTKIKEELIVFGVLSLLMGHWSIFVANICIKSSVFNTRPFHRCIPETTTNKTLVPVRPTIISKTSYLKHKYCTKGYESFAPYESLKQLHRLLFVLAVTHVIYSSVAIALAIFKIYSWRRWEDEAKAMVSQTSQARLYEEIVSSAYFCYSPCITLMEPAQSSCLVAVSIGVLLTSLTTLLSDLDLLLLPLWIYAIFCIFLDFHGTNIYFWLSFLPAIIITVLGTKLHHIVVKIAVEVMDSQSHVDDETQEFKLRDELFWFGKPRLLLRFIQFISFQNALEMAMFLWSLWEIHGTSCFMNNLSFKVIRLAFGIISQIWCSFITFPLYVIIAQMGSRFKKTVLSESVRRSLHGWKKRVKARQNNASKSCERRLSLQNEGSSMTVYGDVGVLFTPQQQSNNLLDDDDDDDDEEEESISKRYDSDTSSDEYYEEEAR